MKRLLNGIGLMNQNAWSDFIKNYWYSIAPSEIKNYIINNNQ